MLRRLLIALCMTVLIQETNLGSLVLGAECVETCADDTAPGHCSPICGSCACGTHVKPVAARATRLPDPALLVSRSTTEAAAPSSETHLPDILHVPKPLVA